MSKLKIWQEKWDQADDEWEAESREAALERPLKGLHALPNMPGITRETADKLKWKSLKWMLQKDVKGEIRRGFLRHPLKYLWAFIKSAVQKKPYQREGDFFLYGVTSIDAFKSILGESGTLLVLGFSYCHKPFECPSGRFTPDCIHDRENPVCRQCFIGKAVNATNRSNTIPLFIPTIHYIGGKIFEIVHGNPDKKVLFIITACEMTLEMFGDWGNMVGIKGLGVRLDGRICNTMKAFELSETGIKPGLTVLLEDTKKTLLELVRQRSL